ncbi:serine/threonine-protein kinase [Salinibacterium sp. ZJ454]|uniref:serine/threonine-protein kinase n=1 Tax=Salinibacterium sp. ZJ454 TaxID=2708339 RepID=UPI00142279FB|nr:serine/threonine-protein kinase [Salinibacterium sp. ZJ454]
MRRPVSSPPDLPGYTFVKVLGSGGFSDVFLYDQHLPKRRVAVKVLLTEQLTPATRAAFVAEANVMAQLSAHPYIVTIYHAGVSADDRPFLVMEYAPGASLADRYKSEAFGVPDALRTGVRLSSAIATAHAAGILHRDIKPANVLTNDFGWPALTDFGIASAVEDDLPVHTTTLGTLQSGDTTGGTESRSIGMSVPWSPPEMFTDDPQPDVRSDVFSLAATIYTLIAGHTPFEVRGRSNGTLDLIGRIERGAITPLTRDDVPRSLVAVLHKGMATKAASRFHTAVDFARALQRVELELGYTPTAIDVPNLVVEAAVRADSADDDDQTRARSIATVEAQPERSRTLTPPPAAPAADDRTQVRGARPIIAQPAAVPDVADGRVSAGGAPAGGVLDGAVAPEETVVRQRRGPGDGADAAEPSATAEDPRPTPPASRANKTALLVGGGVAALITIAVIVSLVVFGAPTAPQAAPQPAGTGGSAIVQSVPQPTLVSAVQEGTSVVFTVGNPEPQDGDIYVWKRSDRPESEPLRPTADSRLVVEGYEPGSTVCIQVSIRRDGDVTADPLEGCYPQ